MNREEIKNRVIDYTQDYKNRVRQRSLILDTLVAANELIDQQALELKQLRAFAKRFESEFDDARDCVLNGRHQLEGVLDNDATNMVLSVLDEFYESTEPPK